MIKYLYVVLCHRMLGLVVTTLKEQQRVTPQTKKKQSTNKNGC